ncbi:MAG: DUF5723 family protein [Mangrovibacterium sp.]
MKRLTSSTFFVILLTLLCLANQTSSAQTNLLFYHSDGYYNAPDYNPAFLTNQKNVTFNLFPLAGMGVSYNNKEAVNNARKILFNEKFDNPKEETFRSLIKKELSYNQFDATLLTVGINSPYGSFNFQIREKVYAFMRFGGDFSRFVMDTLGIETISLNESQDFPTEDVHFREYNLGYANELIRNKLTIGVRAKMYFGKAFSTSNAASYIAGVDGNYYVKSKGDVYFSIPATDDEQNGEITKVNVMDGKTVSDYVFNSGNSGFGLDFGLNWKINPQLEFSAAVLDVGSIKWKKYLYRFNFDEGSYQIENVELDPVTNTLTKGTDEINLIDDISQLYNILPTDTSYVTRMPGSYLVGLNYRYNEKLSFGILNRYIQEKNMGHNSIQATINYKHNKHWTFVSGFGVYHNSYKNLPLGLIYHWKRAQFWAGTDNLLSFVVPDFSDYTGFTFGVDFNLFAPKLKYKENEYLPFFKQKKNWRKKSNGLIFGTPN